MFYSKTISLFILLLTFVFFTPSYGQETSTWTTDIPSGGWPGASLGPHINSTLCHSRGAITVQVSNPFGLTLPSGAPFPITVNNNSIVLGMSTVNAGEGLATTLNFSYPVENFSFSVYDIDGNTGSWQDSIIVTANLSGSSRPVTIVTCPPVAGTVCTGSGTTTAQIDAGTIPTGFTSVAGRADFTINGSLNSVTIQNLNHTVPTSSTQFLSISQLTYNCAIVGTSKIMVRMAGQAFGVSPYIVDIDFSFENFGDVNLSNLTALENLDAVFGSGNYTVTSISNTSGPASFNVNGAFNGSANQELIAASSSLNPGQTASIRVTLDVTDYGSYTNSISVTGTTPQSATTSDDSTQGTDSDGVDADNNPDENTPSPLDTSFLPVSLNYFSSSKTNRGLSLEWQTDIEFDHIGFKVFQQDNNGRRYEVSEFIHQSNQQKQSLRTYTTAVNTNSDNPLWLAEYDSKGNTSWYGPFAVNSNSGNKIQNANINWLAKRQVNPTETIDNNLAISVDKTGMQRITYNDLIQAGMNLNAISPQNIVITLHNAVVPIFINGNKQSFDNSTSIDFYGNNIESIYTNQRIYKLSISNTATTQIEIDYTNPTSVIDSWYWQTESYNPNLIYDFSSATNDPWRAETLATFANFNKTIQFPLDELSQIANQRVRLNIGLSGAINYQQTPDVYPTDPQRCGADHLDVYPGIPNDHCLTITVNNLDYQDMVFDGFNFFKKEYLLAENIAATGVVNLTLNLAGESGFAHDRVYIENISIQYPRNLSAINDTLQFTLADSLKINTDLISHFGFEKTINKDFIEQTVHNKAAILVDGFSNSDIIAYALNSGRPIRINNVQISNTSSAYAIKIPAVAQTDKYWVSTALSLIKPSLKPWHKNQNISSTNIDYIIISHPDFIQTSQQLKNYHQANGLNVALINVLDIYAEHSHSIIDPLAIKAFIKEFANNSNLKYVLLVGADNYDYKGYLSADNFSHIPSIYTALDSVVLYAPSDSLYADINGDKIPDLAIGRLPVRTNQELQLLIDKQMVFINQSNQIPVTHFIADAQDDQYSYAEISDELSNLLPNSWTKITSYRDDYIDANTTKEQILNNFKLSPRLTTYLGHSGPRNWFSFPSAFTYNDIIDVDNSSSASVILQWGCWNSYYVEPDANTMAHRFLFNNDKGAVAVFGASALSTVRSEKAFAQLIIPEIAKIEQTIGSSMLNAKRKLANNGDYRDIILGWNLLGDPALKLISQD